MNVKAISVYVGKALLINALFMMISMMISIANGFDSAFTPLLISFLVTLTTGIFPFIFVKDNQSVSLQGGYLTIVISWFLSIVFGMLPYVLWGGEFTLINAWFESVSGYTTTGSTILNDIEALPKSLIFWRSSTHFIGGLGVIVFLLMILPDTSPVKLKLTHLELSSFSKEGYGNIYRSGRTAGIMVTVYLGLAFTETLCLWGAGMTLFDAVNHTFSTVATGGFSTKNLSIMHYDSVVIEIIITVFMALSAMHFGVIFAVFAKRSFKPLKNSIIRYYFIVIATFSLIIASSLKFQGGYESWGKAAMDSIFQTVSFISTTGFAQADNAGWPLLANAILLLAGIHCGCSGSTTGGIKADRMLISLKAVYGNFQKRMHPNSMFRIKIGNHAIDDETISSVFLYIVLYFFVIMGSFLILLVCGTDVGDAFSGTLASLGNVGPGTGNIGTLGNYSTQSEVAKIIYSIDMFLGRLEIFPVLIVLRMIFDKKR